MVLINGVKYACERCIRGHRVTTCTHTDQPLTMIKPKGRPASQCQHCREQRKLKAHHVACTCGKKGKSPGTHLASCLCHKNSHCTCSNKNTVSDPRKKKVTKSNMATSSSTISLDSLKSPASASSLPLTDTATHINGAGSANPLGSIPATSGHINGNAAFSPGTSHLNNSAKSTPSPHSQSKKDISKSSTILHTSFNNASKSKNSSSSSLNGYSKQIFQHQQQQLQLPLLDGQQKANQYVQISSKSSDQKQRQSQDLNSNTNANNLPNLESNYVIEDIVFPFDVSASGGLFDMFSPSDLSQTSSQLTLNGPNGTGISNPINGGYNISALNGTSNFTAANGAFTSTNNSSGINNGQTSINVYDSGSNGHIDMNTSPNMNSDQKNPQSPSLDNIFPLFPLVGSFSLDENSEFNDNKMNNTMVLNMNSNIATQSTTSYNNSSANNSGVLTSPTTGGSYTPASNMMHTNVVGQPKPVYAAGNNSSHYPQTHRPRRPESVLSVTSNSSTATNQLAAYPPSGAGGPHHLGINRNNSILSFDSLPLQHHPKTQKKVVHHHEIPIRELNDDVNVILSRSQSVEPGYGTTLPLAPSVPSLTDVAALTLLNQSQLGINGSKIPDTSDVLFNYENAIMTNGVHNGVDFMNGNNTDMITSGSSTVYNDPNGKLPNGSKVYSYEDYAPMLEGFNDLMSPIFGSSEPTEFIG